MMKSQSLGNVTKSVNKNIMLLTTALSSIAAALTLATFCMHGEYKIRAVAMGANAATMAYTALTYLEGTHSIAAFFLLHTTLLLINAYRLRRLIQKKAIKNSLISTQHQSVPRPFSPSGINMYQWNNKGTPR